MRVVFSTLLSIAIVGTRGQRITDVPREVPSIAPFESYAPSSENPSLDSEYSHSYIVNRLNSVFGGNCSITTQEEDPNGSTLLLCETVGTCFFGYAEYFWSPEEPERPKYFHIGYLYAGGSGSTAIYFPDDSDSGGMERVERFFGYISTKTPEPGSIPSNCSDGPSPQPVPPPTIAPIAVLTVTPTNAPESTVQPSPQPVPPPTIAPIAVLTVTPTNAPESTVQPVNPKTQSANPSPQPVPPSTMAPTLIAVLTVTPTCAPESSVEAPTDAPEYAVETLVLEPVNPNTQSAKAQSGFVASNLRWAKSLTTATITLPNQRSRD